MSWAEEEEEVPSYKWTIDLQAGNPYFQAGIAWADSVNERVTPSRKARFSQSLEYKLNFGRYFSPHWHLAVGVEYYKGSVEKYGVLGDINGSLYPGSTLYATYPGTPVYIADGDEFHSVFDLGDVTQTPLTLTLTREFRVKKNFRPYLGITLEYARNDFSDAGASQYLTGLNPALPGVDCTDVDFMFGRCGPVGDGAIDCATAAADPTIDINDILCGMGCAPGRTCKIDPPSISSELADGLQYTFNMGINLIIGQKMRWAFSGGARYLWSQEPLKVTVSHPFLTNGVNTCLDPDDDGNFTEDCLLQAYGDGIWISTQKRTSGGSTQTQYWQFKSGEISFERWEIFMGARYMFGRRK